MGAVAAAVTFVATGGNLAAAYAVFNLVDSVTTAAVNGGDIGRALAAAVVSTALNFALPGAGSANFLINAGVNAARSAGIAAVTAVITGGDPARAALGGLVSGASSVIPYVGTIVGAGAAAEVQGGKFAHGAIGTGIGIGTFAGTSFLLAKLAQSGNLQTALDGHAARGTRRVQIEERFIDKHELAYRLFGGGEGGTQQSPRSSPLTPDMALGVVSLFAGARGMTRTALAFGTAAETLNPVGTGQIVGEIILGTIGSEVGMGLAGPVGYVVGGYAGGLAGGWIGSRFDSPYAGEAGGGGTGG